MERKITDQKITDYINKQKSPQKEICLKLRKILLKVFPKIREEMKWGAMVYDGGRYYIGVVKYGVNFGFAVSGLSKEEVKRFEGGGKAMRHIKIKALNDINEKKMIEVIRLVAKKAVCKPC